jgi:hypothetical protein
VTWSQFENWREAAAMKITRDVVTDLWPLYVSDECSADTRALIDQFLKDDPALAALLAETHDRDLLTADIPAMPAEQGKVALVRTKQLLRRRMLLLALAIFFSGFAGSFTVDSHGIVWLMWRDLPVGAAVVSAVAVALWCGYFFARRRLAVTGL